MHAQTPFDEQANFIHALKMAKLGYWRWNPGSNELYWSDECFRLMGLSPLETTATMEIYTKAIHPDDLPIVLKNMEQVMTTGSAPDLDYRFVQPDGAIVHVYTRAELIKNELGEIQYLFGTLQDITLQKQQEKALLEAKLMAESSSRAKDSFLSRMTHEFYTPLNSVLGFSGLLQKVLTKDDPNREIAEDIQAGATRLNEMVTDIIDYSLVESSVPESEPVQLYNLLKELSDQRIKDIRSKELKFIFDCKLDTLFHTDPARLKNILNQLLDNAERYNQPGGTITLGADLTTPSTLCIWVEDTGCGITDDFKHLIFRPFERQEQHNNLKTGTGLGLSLCKKLCLSIGGKIDFTSTAGEGSCFWIELPVTTL